VIPEQHQEAERAAERRRRMIYDTYVLVTIAIVATFGAVLLTTH
jgi:hypothetical protein